MNIEGTIKTIMDTVTFDSGFQKREFVIDTGGDYPQMIKFEVIKDRCSLLDNLLEGEEVNVHFNIRGNEYNGKYFVNLQAWKVDGIETGDQSGYPPEEDPF